MNYDYSKGSGVLSFVCVCVCGGGGGGGMVVMFYKHLIKALAKVFKKNRICKRFLHAWQRPHLCDRRPCDAND